MDLSLWPAERRSWNDVVDLAAIAEVGGWFGIWFADHLMPDSGSEVGSDGDCLDAWVLLPAVAATTERLRIGSLVSPVTYRHPATLASAAATLQQVSRGRFVLGVGAGWQRNEHTLYGFEMGSRRERSDRLEEACLVLRSLLDDTRPHVAGDFYRVEGPPRRPAPTVRVPLLVGGKGERRTLRTVARHADEWNGWCDAELATHKLAALSRHCDVLDRDPSTIRSSVNTYLALHDDPQHRADLAAAAGGRPVLAGTSEQVVEQIAELAAAGIDEVIVVDWNLDDPVERAETLDRFTRDVLPTVSPGT